MDESEDLVTQTLKKADAVWQDLIKLLQAEYAGDTKTMLLVRYTDLVFEHHKAIRHLLVAEMYGSAFALVRVLFDPFFRAHWMWLCATPNQVEKIATSDEGVFPKFKRMVGEIDEAYKLDTFFSDFIGGGTLEAMHSYTHSGLRQLVRGFKGRSVESNYPETEIIEVLNVTTVAVCVMARLLTFVTGRQQEADAAEQIMLRFAKD